MLWCGAGWPWRPLDPLLSPAMPFPSYYPCEKIYLWLLVGFSIEFPWGGCICCRDFLFQLETIGGGGPTSLNGLIPLAALELTLEICYCCCYCCFCRLFEYIPFDYIFKFFGLNISLFEGNRWMIVLINDECLENEEIVY